MFNYGAEYTGYQFGILNFIERRFDGDMSYRSDFKGVQSEIINICKNNKWFAKVLPIINFKIEKEKRIK